MSKITLFPKHSVHFTEEINALHFHSGTLHIFYMKNPNQMIQKPSKILETIHSVPKKITTILSET